MVSTQIITADWLSKLSRFPPWADRNFGRGRSVQTTVVILVQQDRAAHFEREYVQLIGVRSVATFAGGP